MTKKKATKKKKAKKKTSKKNEDKGSPADEWVEEKKSRSEATHGLHKTGAVVFVIEPQA